MSKTKKQTDTKITIALLNKYVSKDITRHSILAPWSVGKRSYATDAHILISVPRCEGVLSRNKIGKKIGSLPPDITHLTTKYLPQNKNDYVWLDVPAKIKDLDARKIAPESTWYRSYKYVHQLWAGRAIQYIYAALLIRTLHNVQIACELRKPVVLAHYHDKPLVFRADGNVMGLIMPVRLLTNAEIQQLALRRNKHKKHSFTPLHSEQQSCVNAMVGAVPSTVQPILVKHAIHTIHTKKAKLSAKERFCLRK